MHIHPNYLFAMFRATLFDKIKRSYVMKYKLIFQPKGKAPTKGAKQILMENSATVNFYRNMALGAGLFHSVLLIVLYSDSLTPWTIVSNTSLVK